MHRSRRRRDDGVQPSPRCGLPPPGARSRQQGCRRPSPCMLFSSASSTRWASCSSITTSSSRRLRSRPPAFRSFRSTDRLLTSSIVRSEIDVSGRPPIRSRDSTCPRRGAHRRFGLMMLMRIRYRVDARPYPDTRRDTRQRNPMSFYPYADRYPVMRGLPSEGRDHRAILQRAPRDGRARRRQVGDRARPRARSTAATTSTTSSWARRTRCTAT